MTKDTYRVIFYFPFSAPVIREMKSKSHHQLVKNIKEHAKSVVSTGWNILVDDSAWVAEFLKEKKGEVIEMYNVDGTSTIGRIGDIHEDTSNFRNSVVEVTGSYVPLYYILSYKY